MLLPAQPGRYTGALCDIIKSPTSEPPPLPRCVHAASESDSLCASLRIRPAMRGPFLTCRLTAGKSHVCFLQACLPRSTDGAVTALLSFSRCSFSGVGWGGVGASQGPPRVKVRRGVEEAVQQGVNNSLCIAEERLRARCPLCTRTGLGRTAACDWPVPRQGKRITGASQVVRLCCGGGGWGRWREGAVLRDFKMLFLALTHVLPVRR